MSRSRRSRRRSSKSQQDAQCYHAEVVEAEQRSRYDANVKRPTPSQPASGISNTFEEKIMKKMISALSLALALGFPMCAQEKEVDRVENAGKALKEILDAPDSIPQDILDKTKCVVILPSVLKFAIGIGGSYGRGVMTCRGGETFHGPWGPPAMMALEGGSVGLQLGGNATDFVLLLMSDSSARGVLTSKVKLGADASAAAGPVGRAASAESDVTLRAEILSYSRSRGLFAGVSLEGSTLRPDNKANKELYSKEVEAKDIVFKEVVPAPDSAKGLLATLKKASPTNKGK
jgi:lipid-binding SYLF domain-containing protein